MAATVKYFGVYSDASYGAYDRKYMVGFTSLADARWYYSCVQAGGVDQREFIENEDGKYVPWSTGYTATPATTYDGELAVYGAERDAHTGEYAVYEEPMARISRGPLYGIKVERF